MPPEDLQGQGVGAELGGVVGEGLGFPTFTGVPGGHGSCLSPNTMTLMPEQAVKKSESLYPNRRWRPGTCIFTGSSRSFNAHTGLGKHTPALPSQ